MFNEHFEKYVEEIFYNKTPMSFARYGDGERLIIKGGNIGKGTQAFEVDKWQSNGFTLFSDDLKSSLNNIDDNFIYGISCPCCDVVSYNFYMNEIKNKNKTFANLWVNANYHSFINIIKNIKEDVVMIANQDGLKKTYPFNILKYFSIKNDIVNYYNENKDNVLKELSNFVDFNNKLVLISAGPFSEIAIDYLWKINKSNRYIDVGSAMDFYIHGKATRPYMINNNKYSSKTCSFKKNV